MAKRTPRSELVRDQGPFPNRDVKSWATAVRSATIRVASSAPATCNRIPISRSSTWLVVSLMGAVATACFAPRSLAATPAPEALHLHARSRVASKGPEGASTYHVADKTVDWAGSKTALIICDMWDDHWCRGAAARVNELAVPLNKLARRARAGGAGHPRAEHVRRFLQRHAPAPPRRPPPTPGRRCRCRRPSGGVLAGAGPTRAARGPCRSTTPTWAATAQRPARSPRHGRARSR